MTIRSVLQRLAFSSAAIFGFFGLIAAVLMSSASAEPTDREKLALKTEVIQHIQAHSDGDTYFFVDQEDVKLHTLTFVAMHPVVFEHPDGMFVLCADFEDLQGEKFLVDYYLRKIGNRYVVLSSVEGKRSLLMKLAEKFSLN
ncbi:MAG: hypothetical protein NXI19_03495 [Alphaproteobacteria bacterium]|nr:hypothetical protein [Alphaproteobacteria bacterium]